MFWIIKYFHLQEDQVEQEVQANQVLISTIYIFIGLDSLIENYIDIVVIVILYM